ncbi:hypothetical protein CW749_21540 [Vibrio sp. vnigr-6D03]|nr:hypothetical protein CW749_21540 [Vibrio sp. vnigr-6D03]
MRRPLSGRFFCLSSYGGNAHLKDSLGFFKTPTIEYPSQKQFIFTSMFERLFRQSYPAIYVRLEEWSGRFKLKRDAFIAAIFFLLLQAYLFSHHKSLKLDIYVLMVYFWTEFKC